MITNRKYCLFNINENRTKERLCYLVIQKVAFFIDTETLITMAVCWKPAANKVSTVHKAISCLYNPSSADNYFILNNGVKAYPLYGAVCTMSVR